jgi:hypothetical protein
MEAKHTPGPWNTDEQVIFASSGEAVASTWKFGQFDVGGRGSHAEADANARLIAAAPELLAALKSALSWITVLTETSPGNAEDMRDMEHKRDYLGAELRAAIAKAEGR